MEFEAVLMFVLLVLYLLGAAIKALFRLVTGAAQREQEEEQWRQDEQRRQEEERDRQEQLRRKIKEDAKKQFEEAVMGGRFPSDEVLTILADCDHDMPVNLKEAFEELLWGTCTLRSIKFGDAVCLIRQRQRPAERAKARAARGDGRGSEPTGAVTKAEACNLLGVSEGCSPEELASAYHRKVLQWHPDKLNETMAQELKEHATRRTARINEAYQKLRSARA